MTALWAIIKLTFKSSIRSHIFQLLLFLLVVCVFMIPTTIAGDGTAWGFIQISLKYSLSVSGFILAMSTIWIGCFAMTRDLESYQLHMVVTKPVSRVTIWIGKWLGVSLIHALLLFISCAIIYVLVLYQFHHRSFDEKEKARINSEVLVGRRVFLPELPDIDKIVQAEYNARWKAAREAGASPYVAPDKRAQQIRELRKQVFAQLSEVRPGPANMRFWKYTKLDPEKKTPLFIRYRPYVGKVSTKEQRETKGMWFVEVRVKERVEDEKAQKGPIKKSEEKVVTRPVLVPRSQFPESVMCGVYNELTLNPEVVSPEGTVVVGFTNFDLQGKPLFFELADGPKLLIKVTGFWNNYCRAVCMELMKILFLAGLSCAAGSFLSMPTAIFMVVSYIVFGSCATYLAGAEQEMLSSGVSLSQIDLIDRVGGIVSNLLLWVVIPIQRFEVSAWIANGELIELGYIGRTFMEIFVFRGLPLIVVCVFLYWRRELGVIVRK